MLISFCAGVLLGAVFFHMVPEISPILGKKMGFPIMLGFLGIYVMEKFIMVHPCEEGACDYHKIRRCRVCRHWVPQHFGRRRDRCGQYTEHQYGDFAGCDHSQISGGAGAQQYPGEGW